MTTAREIPRDGAEALRNTQAVCGFRCWASKFTPLFHTISTMVAIFRAKVSRAISGRIQIHRILRDEHTQRSTTEDKLSIATELQRVEPAEDEMDTPRIISGNQDLPESRYKLQFLDYGQRTVLTL